MSLSTTIDDDKNVCEKPLENECSNYVFLSTIPYKLLISKLIIWISKAVEIIGRILFILFVNNQIQQN